MNWTSKVLKKQEMSLVDTILVMAGETSQKVEMDYLSRYFFPVPPSGITLATRPVRPGVPLARCIKYIIP